MKSTIQRAGSPSYLATRPKVSLMEKVPGLERQVRPKDVPGLVETAGNWYHPGSTPSWEEE